MATPSRPLKVVVTGSCSNIGTNLSHMVARGKAFGGKQTMELVLVDKPHRLRQMTEALAPMRAFPQISKCTCTGNHTEAFNKADVIFICDGAPPSSHITRSEFIGFIAHEFESVCKAFAMSKMNPNVKILVVSEPQNINMQVIMEFAPSIKRHNIMGLSRTDQNRAATCIARMLGIPSNKVKKMTAWGNRSKNILLDVDHAEIEILGKVMPAQDAINNDHFIKNQFNEMVNTRQEEIEKRRRVPLCLPIAAAAVQHMKEWVSGSAEGNWSSMIVASDGSYRIPEGLPFSFPVRVSPQGEWEIVQGLEFNTHYRDRLDQQVLEIKKEINLCYASLNYRQKTPKADGNDDDRGNPWGFGTGIRVPCRIIKMDTDTLEAFGKSKV